MGKKNGRIKKMALEPMSEEEKVYIEALAQKVLMGAFPNPK